ncbi:hypothetical protein GUJ93_ZPchr0003g17887 [Zizania palustris]|uniref:Uncharacterized protein n=1 Tax=Zizania palustris TaxID=103762 RepID=A0A8J5S2Q9_ZIZPA|nr:hypothetical protein GUJ93_ZPchr0003g17887 [Zizania palustris]
MAGLSSKPRYQHHHSEASAPATSVAVAAARAGDGPRVARRQDDLPSALRRSAAFPPRRQQTRHLHQRCDSEKIRQPRCGEVAGGAAAGCAAVCLCFPAAVVEVVVLATVRAPAALCRRAVRARRRRRSASAGQAGDIYELIVDDGRVVEAGEAAVVWPAAPPPAEEAAELEKEVWATFYGAGFWRSPSQLSDEVR